MPQLKKVPDYYARPGQVQPSGGPSGATVPAFLLGTLLCVAIGAGTVYSNLIIKGSFMAWAFSTPAALFLLFYLVLANGGIRALSRRLALTSQELTLIYIMMIVAATLPTFGMVSHLLPMITCIFYFDTPENEWASLLHPHLPDWIAPRDHGVITGFYEGSADGVPWDAWTEPLLYWLIFLLALYLVTTSLAVMVRRPWIERERLQYPIVQAPIELVAAAGRGRFDVPKILRQPSTWIGFAVPALVITSKALHGYHPAFPVINLQHSVPTFGDLVYFDFRVSFSLLAFSYFISRSLSLGIWVFYLLTNLELGMFYTLGIVSRAPLSWWSNTEAPYLTFQALGAMVVFAILPLWRSRHHFRDVAGKAFGRRPHVFDGDEIISYRAAVFSLIGGLIVMVVWLEASGVPLWVVPLFLAIALLLLLAITRIVAEAGVALLRAPVIAPDLMIGGLGVQRLGMTGLTGLAYTYPWTADLVTFPMASVANGLKMAHEVIQGSRRAIFWAIAIAIPVTLVSAAWMMLDLAYAHGGINMPGWWWEHSARIAFDYVAQTLKTPSTIGLAEWMFAVFGGVAMWLLVNLQQRVVWWPLHPLGLAISGTTFTANMIWFNVFLAWTIKTFILNYGGSTLYQRTRYFFLGMIIGTFVTSGTWLVIDYLTGRVGNMESNML